MSKNHLNKTKNKYIYSFSFESGIFHNYHKEQQDPCVIYL